MKYANMNNFKRRGPVDYKNKGRRRKGAGRRVSKGNSGGSEGGSKGESVHVRRYQRFMLVSELNQSW